MTDARTPRPGEVRELRLEGWTLYAVGALILVALVAAFYLGRWVERGGEPAAAAPALTGSPPREPAQGPGSEAPEEIRESYFDTVEGPEQEAEPQREVPRAETAPAPAPPAARTGPPKSAPVAEAPYSVQIMALRDEASARTLLRELRAQGVDVRLVAEREGRGTLYKLRVGAYATRQEAEASAEKLRQSGYAGAFVVRREEGSR